MNNDEMKKDFVRSAVASVVLMVLAVVGTERKEERK